MALAPSKELDSFPYPIPDREYVIDFGIEEFTCLCPLTNKPDFAHFYISYSPAQLCVELKS